MRGCTRRPAPRPGWRRPPRAGSPGRRCDLRSGPFSGPGPTARMGENRGRAGRPRTHEGARRMRNAVQLITYADRLGGDLRGLREVLTGPLGGLFGGVHVLPFFTPYDGADAGFDPADHRAVDPRLGTWTDVEALA